MIKGYRPNTNPQSKIVNHQSSIELDTEEVRYLSMLQQLLRHVRRIERWQRTLYIIFFSQITATMGFSLIFPFLPLYVQSLGSTTGASVEFLSGLVFSVQGLTMMVASPIWGVISDRYGRKLMVQRATIGGGIIVLLMGFARSAEELILIRLIQGFITGVVSASNALVASIVPREQMGYAMGLLQVGLWAGVAVGPLLGGFLADTFGFRMAFIITAILLILSGLTVWWGVEENFVPPDKTQKQSFNFWASWQHILSTPGVGITYGLRFLSNLARMMVFPIMPLFIASLLAEGARVSTLTGFIIGTAAAASTATAVYLGRLGDRIGHEKVLVASALASALFYTLQGLVAEAWQLLILQACTGAATGGVMPTISALLARYTQEGEEGSVYGLDNAIGSGARGLSPMIGAAIAFWFGLRGTFVATGILFLLLVSIAVWWLPGLRNRKVISISEKQIN